MKYSIIFSSKSGNTAQLAEAVKSTLSEDECIHYGDPDIKAKEADLIFIGFWTDKGCCDDSIKEFLQELKGKKVFIFGTAGFGGSEAYFSGILNRVKKYVDSSNIVIDTYMCQGKMPISIRERYEEMMPQNPKKMQNLIENFDKALSHPSSEDLEAIKNKVKKCIYEINGI